MDPLKRRQLGRTAVQIDQLALGLVPLGNLYRFVSDDEAERVLQTWWDHGLRTFDVAPIYGFGIAEERLGRFLEGRPRDTFVISTKVGRPIRSGAPPDPRLLMPDGTSQFVGTPAGVNPYHDYSRDGILWGLERSLERLRLDRVDYLHIHDPDDHIRQAVEEAFPVLADLRTSGVIGAVGTGVNWSGVAISIARYCDIDCVLLAGRYTLLDQEGLAELLPLCLDRGISVIAGGVFNGGFLADPKLGGMFQYRPTTDVALVDRALRMRAVCERHGVPLKAAAVQFPLGHPAVVSVVVGAGSDAHATEVIGAFERAIPDAVWAELLHEGLLPEETPVPLAHRAATDGGIGASE